MKCKSCGGMVIDIIEKQMSFIIPVCYLWMAESWKMFDGDQEMTFVEAIKKAYEKACYLKSKDECGYNYYATVCREGFNIDVHDDGNVYMDLYDWTVDDLTADDWKFKWLESI